MVQILAVCILHQDITNAQSTGGITSDTWAPLSQPDLGSQLSGSSELSFKDIAPPPQKCRTSHRPYLVPNPGGEGWDMIYPYFSGYGGSGEAIIHDFGSGTTTRQVWGDNEGSSITGYGTDFHMQPAYYTHDKVVFYVWIRDGSFHGLAVSFLVYDPSTNEFTNTSIPDPPGGYANVEGAAMDMNEEGMVYGIGWDEGGDGYVPVSFNAGTMEGHAYDKIAPYDGSFTVNYRECKAVGDWAYAAIGNSPWRLVAYNFKTGEGKILAESAEIRGDHNTLSISKVKSGGERGVKGYIRQARWIEGIGDCNIEEYDFWLYNGEIYKREDNIAPWSGKTVTEAGSPSFDWQREGQHWPEDFTPPPGGGAYFRAGCC